MSGQRALLWAALLGVGVVVVFAQLLQQVRLSPEGGVSAQAAIHGAEGQADEAAALAQDVTRITVDKLPCFGCHALAQYLHGTFSHKQHGEEGVGHCHRCHAFKGHFQVVTREATCGECH